MIQDKSATSGLIVKWLAIITSLCLVLLALFLRYKMILFENYDTDGYLRWYDFIAAQGISRALGKNFSIYTPPYLYLLSLATLTQNFIPKIVAIKIIPIVFDFINAFIVYKIARIKYAAIHVPILAASTFLLVPTVMVNSSFWGQIDSLYTCFLLLTAYYLLRDRPIPAMIAFGVAASIKAQAAFLAPFLLLMGFKKKIPWYAFGIVPLIYLAMMLPAILAGRPVWDVITVYLNQAKELRILSANAPNLYIFVPQSTYSISVLIGFGVAILGISYWILTYARRAFPLKPDLIFFTALVSVALTPLLLPKMHDRYFYPADIFSLVLILFYPELWFVPVSYQVISLLAYSIFLFDVPRQIPLILSTELNTVMLAYLLWKQYRVTHPARQTEPLEPQKKRTD